MKRIISILLVAILVVFLTPPVFASSAQTGQLVPVVGVLYNQSFKSAMDSKFDSMLVDGVNRSFCWRIMDKVVARVGYGGFTSYADLSKACTSVNQAFSSARKKAWWGDLSEADLKYLELAMKGPFSKFHWVIESDSKYGYLIKDKTSGLVLCNSSGAFPYFQEVEVTPEPEEPEKPTQVTEPLGGKWVRIDKISKVYNIVNEATFDDLTTALTRSGQKPRLVTHGENNKVLQRAGVMDAGMPLIYCDTQNRPYAMRISDSSYAVNNSQNYYTKPNKEDQGSSSDPPVQPTPPTQNNTTVYDEGDTENNILIDIDNNVSMFPDGTFNYIENLLYDESTKTYYVDAHKEYDLENNTYITNNYSYTYHINYTSITYIGATEEYNKTYELYYQLPDGRNSADLTAEELKALNVSVDVVPYIRSTDNTALRSLYHFDGNVNDSSYWNYATSFAWKKGASITYLESNAFNGCLYLDETEHEFEITAPSGIGSQDFTLQWRMYGSATPAPVTDSWVSIGGDQLFTFSGSYITFNGTQYAVPMGNWYEIALIRQSGTLRLYLNGIQVGSKTHSAALGKTVLFHFGSQQQTYKQLDELRLLNYALVKNGSAYTPTAVPYDTNLALVLPDSTTPVADEYWKWDRTITPLKVWDFTQPGVGNTLQNPSSDIFGTFMYSSSYSAAYEREDYTSVLAYGSSALTNSSSGILRLDDSSVYEYTSRAFIPKYGLSMLFWKSDTDSSVSKYWRLGDSINRFSHGDYINRPYTFSIVTRDGSVYSLTVPSFSTGSLSGCRCRVLNTVNFSWGKISFIENSMYKSHQLYYFWIEPKQGVSLDLVYAELVEGSNPNTGHEFVTSIAPVNSDFKTPTLAVRTDLKITGHQIGGVRPSLPEKGLVWALVEGGRMNSLQIYNGQAWEAVDGRIWTGSRWVPYYAYDVLLLKDLYDVIEGDPSQEYIYTEEGFWAWFQRAWNQQLITRLDAILSASGGAGGSGSGDSSGSFFNKIGDAFSDGLASLVKGIFDLISTVLEKILGLATEFLSFLFDFVTDALMSAIQGFFGLFTDADGPLFDFFHQEGPENEEGNPTAVTALPSGVAAVFAFFSGAVMTLPAQLRSLLIFGVALMFLFSIFKMVSRH